MADSGVVDRDGFRLEWVREGRGLPMMVLGARRFYPRYFPESLRAHFEIVFCDLRQWVPTREDVQRPLPPLRDERPPSAVRAAARVHG